MFDAISQTMAAWVIAVGSIFVSPESGTDVGFSLPSLALEDNSIVLSVDLVEWHTEKMDRILEAGQTITIHFDLDVFKDAMPTPLYSFVFNHTITMDLIDQMYHINCSERNMKYETLERDVMRRHAGSLQSIRIIDLEELNGDTTVFFQLHARLENIDLPGLMHNFDMMGYWRGISPLLESPGFKRSDFIL